MNNGLCPNNSSCREDLLSRLDAKISLKYFASGLSIALTLIGIFAVIGYNAYAGRAKTFEQTQTTQGKAIQSIDKTVTVIQTKQETIIDAINELKKMLKEDRVYEKRRRDKDNSNKWNNKVP